MYNDAIYVLYQILIVLSPILPILIYNLFFREGHDSRRKSWILALFLLIMLFLTMSFPVEFIKGYRYDLRLIPIIVAFVYGGIAPGLVMVISMLVYRFYIGGPGFYLSVVMYSIPTIIFIYYVQKYKITGMRKKLIAVSLGFLIIVLTKTIALIFTNQFEQFPFMIIFYPINLACLLTVVFLIESINQQLSLRKELQRTEKLNGINQLAASVAHEVRNPMTAVRGFLQLMSGDDNLNDVHRNYVNISLQELDRAQSIISDYLSLAKPHNQALTIINISNEVKKTIELMTSYSNIQNISIHTSIQGELYIKGNKDEIKQVLVNIMKNGIEAMPSGGTLSVILFEEVGMVSIEIIDNGMGMNYETLKNLGTPFYSTKEKGTGVGLTISYNLIESMKGKIMVNSEIGKGTHFIIKFPSVDFECEK
ncbi:sporulation kinase [Peribacillus saganii]|uniref:histidine kinase n=1 Tax=Peribacillus saganii TaxID=2303992 RepID=A0A372LL82_9BACI|nr:ATP-binding protein [Peribacillus saganii]RFU67535.1 sporulation kinase [Peribacillus saganii]